MNSRLIWSGVSFMRVSMVTSHCETLCVWNLTEASKWSNWKRQQQHILEWESADCDLLQWADWLMDQAQADVVIVSKTLIQNLMSPFVNHDDKNLPLHLPWAADIKCVSDWERSEGCPGDTLAWFHLSVKQIFWRFAKKGNVNCLFLSRGWSR